MTRRRLRPDELTLWQEVARNTTSLSPHRKPQAASLTDRPDVESKTPKQTPPDPPQFEIGQAAARSGGTHDVLPPLSDRLKGAPVSMDKKAFQRLKRGKLVPEAKLDLHGMTLEQAHPALNGFILRSHAAGHRLVLIVTGKGRDRDPGDAVPVRRGVLRHSVPQWLRMAPLSALVLQITEAHLRHGGGGAYYVYLRRQR
ncbi:Smr/MutS family protein [Roseovarius sp. D22-M7]|uniref:Smr/MutS family protein n=1 Tax=Roseovarius sp. D22-M7 TaxID=3127116 RepID=UPI0030101B68